MILYFNGNAMSRVTSFKFLRTFITEALIWIFNTNVKPKSSSTFFSNTQMSISQHHSKVHEHLSSGHRGSAETPTTAEPLAASLFTTLNNIFTSRSLQMSCYALKDSSHPANHLLQLLPSGKHTHPLKQAPHHSSVLFCFTPEP